MDGFEYEIVDHIGTVSISPNGKYSVEVNLISFNNAPAKVDIRKWDAINRKMFKGITLTQEEADVLGKLLLGMKVDV